MITDIVNHRYRLFLVRSTDDDRNSSGICSSPCLMNRSISIGHGTNAQSIFEGRGVLCLKHLKSHLRCLIKLQSGVQPIVSKWLLAYMTPIQILFFRYLIAVVFLSLLYPKFSKPVSLVGELLFLAIGAALALYFVFENTALQLTYSSNVSLIVATIPFMTGALSCLFYRKRFFNL